MVDPSNQSSWVASSFKSQMAKLFCWGQHFFLHLFASNTEKWSDDVIMTSQWRYKFRFLPNVRIWSILSISFFCVSLMSFGSSKLRFSIQGLIFEILDNSNRLLRQNPHIGIELSLFQLKFLFVPDISWTPEYSQELLYFYERSWSRFLQIP